MESAFWTWADDLIKISRVVIDRPRGSTRPRYPTLIYPLDYGYLEGTTSSDNSEVDVWQGTRPGAELDAVVCTVDRMKKDLEVKVFWAVPTTRREQSVRSIPRVDTWPPSLLNGECIDVSSSSPLLQSPIPDP
jgi:inorganic pyrophosphatase